MIGKTDWIQYLYQIRKREINLVLSFLPKRRFTTGLEIGAGDGFQTMLLSPYVDKLISSDLNFKRIKKSLKIPGVEYKVMDADAIESVFKNNYFNLIFSSNVLEHLRDPSKFLAMSQPMLTDDGFAVHIVPSRHIKIFYLLLYYPNLALLAFDRILGKLKGKKLFQGSGIDLENNINVGIKFRKSENRFKKFLIPTPHGNFSSHWKEFVAFGKKSWERKFIESGYVITAYAKGEAFSGYGFGISIWLRNFLRKCGFSSEHIFILKKMSKFEADSWIYTKTYLSRGNFYEQKKFFKDWLKKEKNARTFLKDFTYAVDNSRGKKVLDIGFGNGLMLLEFSRIGAVSYGLETENELLNIAKERFRENKKKAVLKIYNGKVFPFPDNTFDYVYSTSVLEHMSHPQEVLKEIARTLKPGGKFYLSFPNKYAPKESHTGLWFISWLPRSLTQYILKLFKSSPLEDWNLHFISYFDMKNMAKKAGLKISYDTKSNIIWKSGIKKLLARLGIHYGILLKTIIIVLKKPA